MPRGHLYRRKKPDGSWSRWYAVVDLPRLDPDKRRQVTRAFDTRRQAQQWFATVLAEHDNERGDGPTVAQFLQSWLESRRSLRPSTTATYRAHVERHLLPRLGTIRLARLRPEDVERAYLDLQARGMTPATLTRVHATLSTALNHAVRRKWITTNPAALVDLPRVDTPETATWSPEEVGRFLASTSSDRLAALWRLAVLRGLRRGELLGLRWDDLDLHDGLLRVRQTLVPVGPHLVTGPPKSTAGRRTVVLDQGTVTALRSHKARQARERLASVGVWADTGLVFIAEDGEPLSPAWVSRRFQSLAAQAGLSRIRFHDLRHTSATLGLAAGESLKEISTRLGHADLATTADIYTDVTPPLAQASADRLAALVEDPRTPSEALDDLPGGAA